MAQEPLTFERILETIEAGCNNFTAMAERLCPNSKKDGAGPGGWRKLDSQLQRMRKQGLIKYSRKTGWEVCS